jgi:drug/metabolite transporter (DMT)-like permease
MPPLGVLFGWFLLGERVELADLFGISPVALGIYLVTHGASEAATKAARIGPTKQSTPSSAG